MALFNIYIGAQPAGNPVAGETINAGNLVYLASDGLWYNTTASDKTKSTTEIMLATTEATATDELILLEYGEWTYAGTPLVAGDKYYVSVATGQVTNTVYDDSVEVIRYVGTAKTTSVLLFNPDQTYISDYNSTVNDIIIRPSGGIEDHNHLEVDITDLDKYTQAEVQELLDNVAYTDYANYFSVEQEFNAGIRLNNTNIESIQQLYFQGGYSLSWNTEDSTVDIETGLGPTLQVGQETLLLVKNQTGSTITDGTPVMFAGSLGASGRLLAQPALADGSLDSVYTIGVTTQDILNGEDGFATTFGKVRGLDTTGTPYGETWADGDILYIDPVTPGGLTKVQPSAPDFTIHVAVVINAHATEGALFVRPTWHENVLDSNDVNGTVPVDRDILIWDDTNKYFDAGRLTEADIDNVGPYDNYVSWNLKTDNVQRTTVVAGGDLDIVGGTDISVAYSAGGVVTINSTGPSANNYVDGATFNTLDGVLTLSRLGLADVTVDLDGRYLTTETDSQILSWVDGTNTLSISNGNSVVLTGFSEDTHTHLLATGATDVTATAAEVNLLDLSGLTAGWALIADTATTASWQAIPVGATSWLGLTDTDEPDYVGHAGDLVRVNATPDGLEFVDGTTLFADSSHTHVLTDITDVTATASEVNLLDLAGLTVGWVLSADSATTASWKAPTGGGAGDYLSLSDTDNTYSTFAGSVPFVNGLENALEFRDIVVADIADHPTLLEAYITDLTAQGLLEDTANWDIDGVYTGTAITGTFQGQKHYDAAYFFDAAGDNFWLRYPRA